MNFSSDGQLLCTSSEASGFSRALCCCVQRFQLTALLLIKRTGQRGSTSWRQAGWSRTQEPCTMLAGVGSAQRDVGLLQEVDHGTTVWWSDFSRDGAMLCTASDDRSVRVYDCSSWKLLEMFGHGLPAKCASFSPDGQSVATASGDAFVRIFDLDGGDEVHLAKRKWSGTAAMQCAGGKAEARQLGHLCSLQP